MSDTGRQSLADKATNALKPDSKKSTAEHMGDNIKGKIDDLASNFQPKSQKSCSQKIGDSLSSDPGDDTPLADKSKEAVDKSKKAVLGDD